MSDTTDLVQKVQAEIDAVHEMHQAVLQDALRFSHVAANPVLERVPREIARLIVDRRISVDLCEICEFATAATTPLFEGEPLFFVAPPPSDEVGAGYDIKKVRLIGAAKMIFDYCKENELSPMLCELTKQKAEREHATAQWDVLKLRIFWRPIRSAKDLRLKPFKQI